MAANSKKYAVQWSESAKKDIAKIDNSIRQHIFKFLKKEAFLIAPQKAGKPLQHNLFNLWRYRIGGFRVIAEIQDQKLIILIIAVGNRDEIYN
jgi:mRNA interferase RelE/StbE